MTPEQKKAIEDAAKVLKRAFVNFTGNIQFDLNGVQKDIKYSVKSYDVVKS